MFNPHQLVSYRNPPFTFRKWLSVIDDALQELPLRPLSIRNRTKRERKDGYFFPGMLFRFCSGNFASRFFPYCFCFCFCWECFTSTRSSRKGRGRSTRASVTVTKGGNRKGISLTRDFFAVVFSFTGFGFLWARFLVFRVSLGVLPEKASHLTKEK